MSRLPTDVRVLAASGAALAALAAALAAAGSHALAGRLAPADLTAFHTAVAFQFVNALGLFAAAWTRERLPASFPARLGGWLLLAGILLFCGSIYATRLGLVPAVGPLAPLGGSAVILGWLMLAVALARSS